jgi:hypothetical protein
MKHLFSARNIFETVFPFYLLLKIFGFLPFSLDVKKRRFTSSWLDYLYCYLVIGIHLLVMMIVYSKSFAMFEISKILREGAQLEEFLSISTVIICFFVQCYKQEKIKMFIHLLHQYDLKVRPLITIHVNFPIIFLIPGIDNERISESPRPPHFHHQIYSP